MNEIAHTGRILVVEDELLVGMDMAEAFRAEGYDAMVALSAEEGLAILEREGDVRVVFTDIDLPGRIDGIDLANEIERRWPQIEILMTSGHHVPNTDLVRSYGRFVPKPYPPAAVVRRVNDILGARQGYRNN